MQWPKAPLSVFSSSGWGDCGQSIDSGMVPAGSAAQAVFNHSCGGCGRTPGNATRTGVWAAGEARPRPFPTCEAALPGSVQPEALHRPLHTPFPTSTMTEKPPPVKLLSRSMRQAPRPPRVTLTQRQPSGLCCFAVLL